MDPMEGELVLKTEKLTLNTQGGNLMGQTESGDIDDFTPNRGRFFSSMNYKEYVTKFDKPPSRPQIIPLPGDPIQEKSFSLDGMETEENATRSYSRSVPMRPLETSASSSLKSNLEAKTIEEEDEDEDIEGGSNQEVPIYPIDQLPKDNNIVTNIIQNNEFIRSRSQSENFSKLSIFNFCQNVRSKQNSVIN